MKKITMKKTFTISTLCATAIISTVTLAGTPPIPPSGGNVLMLQQLKALNTNVQVVGNRMQAIAEANAKTKAGGSSPNLDILEAMIANPAFAQNKNVNQVNTDALTEQDIQGQLQPFSDNLIQPGPDANSAKVTARLATDLNYRNLLTAMTPASDSVYSNDPAVIALSLNSTYQSQLPPRGLVQPTAKNSRDDYFNFGSLVEPTAYDPLTNQPQAAQMYIAYLTKSYDKPSDAIDFSAFKSKLSQAKDATDKISLYMDLLNDKDGDGNLAYRKYQLAVRSATAARSVAINNFEKIASERTLVKNLGKTAGLKDSKGKSIDDASPLQVESYLANRRVDSPSWYAQLQSESSVNVQRDMLVVLAEIEAQNFQAHMDRERMLATMSAQSALGSTMTQAMLIQQAQAISKDIGKFILPSQAAKNTAEQKKTAEENKRKKAEENSNNK